MKRVAVVILNWNGLDFLKKFLPGVIDLSAENASVWIIDNGSTDKSLDYINSLEGVNLVVNEENFGFAKGYNEGLKQIDSDYYVLLNSDVEVSKNWIKPVIDFMMSENMAACQPKILDYHQKDQFEHAGAAGGFLDRDAYPFCAGRIMDSFEKDLGQYNQNQEVFWASGAALFVEAKLYHQIGGLDADFFAHMEEIDLCWRLKNQGYKVGRCGNSHVYHIGGGTLTKINPFKTYLNFRNNLYLITKNFFHGNYLIKLLKRFILDGVAGVKFLTEGKPSLCWAVVKAHFSFYYHFPLMLKKRRELKKSYAPNLKGAYRKSILIDYFFRKKSKFSNLDQENFS